ncbi:hypothetical protein FRB90_011038 [Tulasnella sp. 427]|nr:hypothetical protein FRB90_011038 [Tulasnella sp. 427]
MQVVPRSLWRTPCLHFRGLATVPNRNRQVRDPRQLFKPNSKAPKAGHGTRPEPAQSVVPPALQPEFEDTLSKLKQAHKRRSLLEAHAHWSSLQSKGLLAHVSNQDFKSLDNLLTAFLPSLLSRESPADPAIARAKRKALEDMRDLAIILAAQTSFTKPLADFMELSLAEGRPEDVLQAWKDFESQIPSWSSSSQGEVQNNLEIAARKRLSRPVLRAYAAQLDYRSAIASIWTKRCYLQPDHKNELSSPTSPEDRFLQVVRVVVAIIRPGAKSEILQQFTHGKSPKFALHFYETLLLASQAPEHPWVVISKDRPQKADDADWTTRALLHVGHPTFVMFAAEFVRCNRVDLAQRVADDMAHLGLDVPVVVLNILLDGYAKQRNVAAASRIYALLSERGNTPDLFAHTAMINALFQEGAVDDAMAYFKKAEELFVGEGKKGIHVATYNAVVHGLLINGQVDDAESLVKAMRTSPTAPRPDTITYNTLLRHYARKHDAPNFVRVLQELVSSGLNPDTYTFTTIVDTLLQSNRADAVPRMLDVMEAAKIPANTATYTAIIDCLIRRRGEQSVRAALQLLDKMEGDGVHANEVTFTSLLAGVSRADHLHPEVQSRLVDEIMGKMTARGMDPNRVTRNFLLLDALKTDGILGTDKAMKLWRETTAEKGGGIPHTTYFVLLNGLAKNGRYDYVQEVMDYIFGSGWQPKGSLEKLIRQLQREMALRG